MMPGNEDLPNIFLEPGKMVICTEPSVATTILGSCVSVTLFNRRTATGAICHGLLPKCRESSECDGHCMDNHRYMDCSIMRMLEQFRRIGIADSEIEVKMFGGAEVLEVGRIFRPDSSVGRENIRIARSVIEAERLRIISEDVGGSEGRKILFFTHTGDVYLKRLRKQ